MGKNQAKCNKPPAWPPDAISSLLAIESPVAHWLEHLTGTQGRGIESHLGLGFFPSFHFMQKTYQVLLLQIRGGFTYLECAKCLFRKLP